MQGMSGDVSSVLLTRRMNATGVYRHFSKWKADEQQQAINDCGLAHSHYGNKSKRNEIISHLLKVDLPLDPGLVLRTIKQRNCPLAGAKNPKQFALRLLEHMAGLQLTGLPKPAEVATGPSTELLASTARCVLFDRIQPGTSSVPWAYRQCDTLRKLWPLRRQVYVCSVLCLLCFAFRWFTLVNTHTYTMKCRLGHMPCKVWELTGVCKHFLGNYLNFMCARLTS